MGQWIKPTSDCLPLSGGTMTGVITYSSGKKDTDYLPLSGGTMTGVITFSNGKKDTDKENTSNKVTSISSTSTDTQYPSAKCMYTLIGNIITLIDAL